MRIVRGLFQAANGKEAIRTRSWSTVALIPRFQTLAVPDWSTSPDMSGNAQTSAFMLTQSNIEIIRHRCMNKSGKYLRKFVVPPERTYRQCLGSTV
ncbi:hypothetical protein T10_12134 [Trichinella papuae]|uniref:Uncharacterized protein n=1 Tax=Trichinella papuae TaxID=268474 RepID=A0A0V1MSF2_9BILA|nr:hypothetical protein T10_12134 [Trichinella papuae]